MPRPPAEGQECLELDQINGLDSKQMKKTSRWSPERGAQLKGRDSKLAKTRRVELEDPAVRCGDEKASLIYLEKNDKIMMDETRGPRHARKAAGDR